MENVRPRQKLLDTHGRFQVHYLDEIASFAVLEEAYSFFKQLEVPAVLWEVSSTPYIIITKKAALEA